MKNVSRAEWERIEAIVDAALEQPADARAAFLERACADDEALRTQAEAMLRAGEAAGSFLEDADRDRLLDAFQAEEDALNAHKYEGEQVGAYRILEPIGRGGMGQVFLAQRDDGEYRHRVAVKIIRRGLDTEDLLLRFRTERQILASLNHPNVARLLDGGATADGLPYFVMEYIEGRPLLNYCDAHHLGVKDRIGLFLQVCDAVQYAHQNLVVHRDLKPSNILVTEAGAVKLLDFGIAKLLGPTGASDTATPVTRTDVRVMTPEYASPEQVQGEAVTTASDVYQLGVLLYELLCGHRPYASAGLSRRALEELICERDPVEPSTRVAELETRPRTGEPDVVISPAAVSKARGTSPERLRRDLQGDLDTIVLKALRKEAPLRYPSVEAFQADLNRHLEGLPVLAQRATVGYRTLKFVRRHRVGVTAAAAMVLLLITVAAMALRFAVVTSRQADQIALEAAKAEQVKDFMIGLFMESDPEQARGDAVTARELLARGAEQVEQDLGGQPAVQAEMLHTMGVVYRQLGVYDKALPLLERALAQRRSVYGEATHREIATSLHDLAILHDRLGAYEKAAGLYLETLAMRRTLMGDDHPDVARVLSDLGVAYGHQDRYDEAEPLWREAIAIQQAHGIEDKAMLETTSNLAVALHEKGSYEEAEQLYRQALRLQRRLLGDDHPLVSSSLYNLGTFMYDQERYDDAEALFREAVALRRKVLGPTHYRVATTINWLGRVKHRQGAYAEAEALYLESLTLVVAALGEDHPLVPRIRHILGTLFFDQQAYAEATRWMTEALDTYTGMVDAGRLKPDHLNIVMVRYDLGRALLADGRVAEARPLLAESLVSLEAAGQAAEAAEARAALARTES